MINNLTTNWNGKIKVSSVFDDDTIVVQLSLECQ